MSKAEILGVAIACIITAGAFFVTGPIGGCIFLFLGIVFFAIWHFRPNDEKTVGDVWRKVDGIENKFIALQGKALPSHSPLSGFSFFRDKLSDAQAGYMISFGDKRIGPVKEGFSYKPFYFYDAVTDNKAFAEFSVEEGRLLITAIMARDNGTPVSVMKNQVAVDGRADRNFDDSALEIVDDALRPLLQIVYKSQYDVSVRGVFQTRRDSGINDPSFLPVGRIFKYPSDIHPGTRA